MLHVVLAVVFVLAPHVWSQAQPRRTSSISCRRAAVGSPQGRRHPRCRAAGRGRRPHCRRARRSCRSENRAGDGGARDAGAPRASCRAAMAPRPSAAPRAGDKELPSMASSSSKAGARSGARAERTWRAPRRLLHRTGARVAAGRRRDDASRHRLSLAWYLSACRQRSRALAEQGDSRPAAVAVFEINRDGRVTGSRSRAVGNPYY